MSALDENPAIVLIHGRWMTPRSWEHWIEHYQRRGYRVLAPAYPGLDEPGWEEVADFALNWANEHTGRGVLSTA